jgi:phosphatidylglycerophosphatase A
VRGLAVLLATGLGVGRLPVAPATWASAFTAALLYFLLPRMDHLAYVALTVGVTALALAVCGPAEKVLGHDAHPIVADEVAGMMVTMIAAPAVAPWGPPYAVSLVAGFFLFRLFDIWKPPPVGRAQNLPGAIGIVTDDLLAGVYANLGLQILALLWRAR